MKTTTILNLAAGTFQLLVAVYALRLNWIFGMRRVGWSLFSAFSLLALLHLFNATISFPADVSGWFMADALGFLISLLLFTGMIHLETLLEKRMLQGREINRRRSELELELKKKTSYLQRAMEGLDLEMAERKRLEAKVACLDIRQPGLFESFADMIANIPVQSISRVLAEESYMLGVDLAQQRPLMPAEVGSILIFSQFIGSGGKCPHRFPAAMELPPAHTAFYRQTVQRLIEASALPHSAKEEFEKTFGVRDEQPEVGETTPAPYRNGAQAFRPRETTHYPQPIPTNGTGGRTREYALEQPAALAF